MDSVGGAITIVSQEPTEESTRLLKDRPNMRPCKSLAKLCVSQKKTKLDRNEPKSPDGRTELCRQERADRRTREMGELDFNKSESALCMNDIFTK